MRHDLLKNLTLLLAAAMLLAFAGCSSDEDDVHLPAPRGETIGLTYENPIEVEINSTRRWALLLHNQESSSGPALQLVNLDEKRVVATKILDYFDVYDVEFLPGDQACFAGRPQGNIGYAVQFFTLPNLTLTTRVMTADTAGEHGYLAIDTTGYVYYSHAGGEDKDGLYKISISSKTLLDADNSASAPFGYDNGLVSGLFDHPARICFDAATRKIIVANRDADYLSVIDASAWGLLNRANHTFPVAGTTHHETTSGIGAVRVDAMSGANGIYAIAGTSGNTAYLSRFGVASVGLDFVQTMPLSRSWRYRNSDIRIHAREDIFSAFVVQRDSSRGGVGQYRLNNLQDVAASPYRPQVIADSAIAAIGIDLLRDRIVIADAHEPRLEIISIEP